MLQEEQSDAAADRYLTEAPSVGVRRWAGNNYEAEEQPKRMVRLDRLVPHERACDHCEQLFTESHQHSPVAVSGALQRAESLSCCAAPEAAVAVELLTFECSPAFAGGRTTATAGVATGGPNGFQQGGPANFSLFFSQHQAFVVRRLR